jgi:hypothetical protein
MKRSRLAFIAVLLSCFLLSACGENPASATTGMQGTAPPNPAKGPQIALSDTRLPQGGHTLLTGKGFTPYGDVRSHLKRPDGTEFNELPMFTDAKGEFSHDIESFLLQIGVHEVWVVDTKTGLSSNVAKFETTRDQMPLAK